MKQDLIFESDRKISSAYIDSSVHLGVAHTVLLAQDNVTECFGKLGCDGIIFREQFNVFWVFTKTKVHFNCRPNWADIVKVKTFPIDNAGLRTHVNTEILDVNENRLILINQELCVMSLENRRPVKLSTLPYPKDNFPKAIFTEPFEKFPTDFTDEDFVFEQKILSCHIDMSNHLNNIEYIKFALCTFSNDFLLNNEISDIEVHYTGETKEGNIIKVYSKHIDTNYYISIRENERCVFECCIKTK